MTMDKQDNRTIGQRANRTTDKKDYEQLRQRTKWDNRQIGQWKQIV